MKYLQNATTEISTSKGLPVILISTTARGMGFLTFSDVQRFGLA